MDNFFLSNLGLEELYTSIFDRPEIVDMYFQPEEDISISEEKNEEATLQYLLASFEAESEETISLKIGIMKNMNNLTLTKYEIFYLVNSYINKYFYDMITYQDKELLSLIN